VTVTLATLIRRPTSISVRCSRSRPMSRLLRRRQKKLAQKPLTERAWACGARRMRCRNSGCSRSMTESSCYVAHSIAGQTSINRSTRGTATRMWSRLPGRGNPEIAPAKSEPPTGASQNRENNGERRQASRRATGQPSRDTSGLKIASEKYLGRREGQEVSKLGDTSASRVKWIDVLSIMKFP
jgi:hypothetical protein